MISMANINIILAIIAQRGTNFPNSQTNMIIINSHMDTHKPKVGKLSKELTSTTLSGLYRIPFELLSINFSTSKKLVSMVQHKNIIHLPPTSKTSTNFNTEPKFTKLVPKCHKFR